MNQNTKAYSSYVKTWFWFSDNRVKTLHVLMLDLLLEVGTYFAFF